MEIFKGKSIFRGIAIGKILFYEKKEAVVTQKEVSNPQAELQRFEAAKQIAKSQLLKLQQKAAAQAGPSAAEVFEVHGMMLDDDDYNDSVKHLILEKHFNAEYAVSQTGNDFSRMFSEMNDDYFQARAADIKDISDRVINILCGIDAPQALTDPVILVADDLAPSETIQLDKSKILAFITQYGSTNSHMAILARTMSIPALTGIPVCKTWHNKLAIIDGFTGTFYIEPDEVTLQKMQEKYETYQKECRLLEELKGKETITKSGHPIKLYANIGNVSDVENVLTNDAAGIGLFRSEFLYLEKDHYPTEEEQFTAYKTVAERMNGKKVIIRTLDIGADKKADYFNLAKEDNPAMGYRAIRICLTQPEIFKTQLRAILRAASFGNISIMYPMIISVKEVKKIKEILEEVKAELVQEKVAFGEVTQGVMIETPAAVMISDALAQEVDFFSIGTNDLTQYTLAIDRQNPNLDAFYDPHHPAVLKLIEMTIKNGHAHNCWVGICGELGADPALTETFVKMGIDELSVSPGMVLPIRKIIRHMD